MSKLTDETLMLYADDLLVSPEKEHVERLLADDRALRSRLQVFRLTGRELASLMQDHVDSPVPARLREPLLERSPEPFSLMALYCRAKELGTKWLEKWRFSDSWQLRPSMALILMMLAGIGMGWLLRDGSGNPPALDNFVRLEDSRLVAQGELRRTLETLPSGETSAVKVSQDQIGVGVRMTFQDEAGHYCRQYDIAVPASGNYSGVACRNNGEWIINFQAMTASLRTDTDQIVPAQGGARLAIDAAINALVVGDPVSREEEAALVGRWD